MSSICTRSFFKHSLYALLLYAFLLFLPLHETYVMSRCASSIIRSLPCMRSFSIGSFHLKLLNPFSGSKCHAKRFAMDLALGYGLPLVITIMSGIVEATAPECSVFRPRFAEETCFFTTVQAKALWFYLPIGMFLFINTVMFSLTVFTICKMNQARKEVNGERTENWDQ